MRELTKSALSFSGFFAVGFGAMALLSTCQPAMAHDLTIADMAPETRASLGDIVTDRTGTLCASPVVFDFGGDWVVICQSAPTVWTFAASGDLYENGDLKTAIERNFR